jgi:acid phosphatase family membrane protein YuiD
VAGIEAWACEPAHWPIWVVVLFCGLAGQVFKATIYSIINRHAAFSHLAQGHGFPSLQAALLSCLLFLTLLRPEATPGQAGFALVFAVIVIHDTVKLRLMASRQREAVVRLVHVLPSANEFHQRVADYLDPRTHHPVHVAAGVLWGAVFALAFT